MIDFPIIDPHIHLWDVNHLSYPWLRNHPEINRSFNMGDYRQARGSQEVEAVVFVQAACESRQYLDELRWIQDIADQDMSIQAMVPWAPVDSGEDLVKTLEVFARDRRVKGVRQIIQNQDDIDFCTKPDFIRGVQLLGEFGLHFELTISPKHFPNVLNLAEKCPYTKFVLDHIGNPEIGRKELQPWEAHIANFAKSGPHYCKFSNLVCNADLKRWQTDDLQHYADVVFEAFGVDRVMWASDWPHCLRACSWSRWFKSASSLTKKLEPLDLKKIFRYNAIEFYRLVI